MTPPMMLTHSQTAFDAPLAVIFDRDADAALVMNHRRGPVTEDSSTENLTVPHGSCA